MRRCEREFVPSVPVRELCLMFTDHMHDGRASHGVPAVVFLPVPPLKWSKVLRDRWSAEEPGLAV